MPKRRFCQTRCANAVSSVVCTGQRQKSHVQSKQMLLLSDNGKLQTGISAKRHGRHLSLHHHEAGWPVCPHVYVDADPCPHAGCDSIRLLESPHVIPVCLAKLFHKYSLTRAYLPDVHTQFLASFCTILRVLLICNVAMARSCKFLQLSRLWRNALPLCVVFFIFLYKLCCLTS